jgi:hypothetical protein
MGRKITGDRNKDLSALVCIAPDGELPNSRLQHLIAVEAGIFAQNRPRERSDQCLWRIAELEMPRHEPCRKVDLSLPVKGIEQGHADGLRIKGQIVEIFGLIVWDARRRHVEITSEIDRHRSVQDAAQGRDLTVSARAPDAPQHLVERIRIGEDMMRGLPVAVLVGIAEACHSKSCRISERSAEVIRSCACA